MLSQKVFLSVLSLSLGGTAYSADAPQPQQRFDPAAAMKRLRDLKAQSQVVVRGNVDEQIRKNQVAEAETNRRMDEAAGKVSGQMGQMSQEAANLMRQLDIYRENFESEVKAAANIDAKLLELTRQFKEMLERSRMLGQTHYEKLKTKVQSILNDYVEVLRETHGELEEEIKATLRDMGIENK